jgi:hypothetical protein
MEKNCNPCYKKLVVTKKCIMTNCNNTFQQMPHDNWNTKCRKCC